MFYIRFFISCLLETCLICASISILTILKPFFYFLVGIKGLLVFCFITATSPFLRLSLRFIGSFFMKQWERTRPIIVSSLLNTITRSLLYLIVLVAKVRSLIVIAPNNVNSRISLKFSSLPKTDYSNVSNRQNCSRVSFLRSMTVSL